MSKTRSYERIFCCFLAQKLENNPENKILGDRGLRKRGEWELYKHGFPRIQFLLETPYLCLRVVHV